MRRPFVPEWVYWETATAGGLVTFMREHLGKPIPSPVVLGPVTERFREAVSAKPNATRFPCTGP
jgi:hypothetical protein